MRAVVIEHTWRMAKHLGGVVLLVTGDDEVDSLASGAAVEQDGGEVVDSADRGRRPARGNGVVDLVVNA